MQHKVGAAMIHLGHGQVPVPELEDRVGYSVLAGYEPVRYECRHQRERRCLQRRVCT